MKREKIDALIEQLFAQEENLSIDVEDTGDGIVKITIKSLEDKKEFENWVDKMPDDLFQEIWESLSEQYSLKELNDTYASDEYKEVIDLFKEKANELITSKIRALESLI